MVQPNKKWPRPVGPYNPEAKCVKCGNEEVDVSYCGYPLPDDTSEGVKEHFHRQCKRCGFNWRENCLDIKSVSANITLKEGQHGKEQGKEG